jgi:hypothetical protein
MTPVGLRYFRQIPEGAYRNRFASGEEVQPGRVSPMRCQAAPQLRISEGRNLPFAVLADWEVYAPHLCPKLPLE